VVVGGVGVVVAAFVDLLLPPEVLHVLYASDMVVWCLSSSFSQLRNSPLTRPASRACARNCIPG
jgi:hypothetical protein